MLFLIKHGMQKILVDALAPSAAMKWYMNQQPVTVSKDVTIADLIANQEAGHEIIKLTTIPNDDGTGTPNDNSDGLNPTGNSNSESTGGIEGNLGSGMFAGGTGTTAGNGAASNSAGNGDVLPEVSTGGTTTDATAPNGVAENPSGFFANPSFGESFGTQGENQTSAAPVDAVETTEGKAHGSEVKVEVKKPVGRKGRK